MIRIIGIGSPFGDDAAGLEAARRLAASPPSGCEIVAADRPGLGLIDAVRSSAPPGTLHDLSLRRLVHRAPAPASSHAFGVAAALQLAEQLGGGPMRGRVLGVETAHGSLRRLDGLTASVRTGVACAVHRARWWATRLAAPSRPQARPAAPTAANRTVG
jgi:hydrogenase maturation protease